MPRISVIIPTYNRAHHLKAAVSSVLNQTYTDLELIIVDDGSTDATREVGEQFCHLDNRVRYLYQNNGGPSAARNMGIRAARGDFIAFLDSDDYWMPIKLAEQLAIAEQDARIGVVYCNWEWVLEGGLVSPGVSPPDPSFATMYEALLYYNVVDESASAALVRAECFDQVGLFDESLRHAEDWDMWIRIAEHYQFAKAPSVLVRLLQHGTQSSSNRAGMATAHLALIEKLKTTIAPRHRHHLARVQWHNRLFASELYCGTSCEKSWHALALALRAWPMGLLSPRTWYVLLLSLTGPLYPQANAAGLVLRRWCRRYLGMDSVTGWRGRPIH